MSTIIEDQLVFISWKFIVGADRIFLIIWDFTRLLGTAAIHQFYTGGDENCEKEAELFRTSLKASRLVV